MDPGAMRPAGFNQFASVVAVSPPDYDHDLTLTSKLHRSELSQFCWLANGIAEAYFRTGKSVFTGLDQFSDTGYGLGCLNEASEPRSFSESGYIRFVQT